MYRVYGRHYSARLVLLPVVLLPPSRSPTNKKGGKSWGLNKHDMIDEDTLIVRRSILIRC